VVLATIPISGTRRRKSSPFCRVRFFQLKRENLKDNNTCSGVADGKPPNARWYGARGMPEVEHVYTHQKGLIADVAVNVGRGQVVTPAGGMVEPAKSPSDAVI
jgi:hypothetical protein